MPRIFWSGDIPREANKASFARAPQITKVSSTRHARVIPGSYRSPSGSSGASEIPRRHWGHEHILTHPAEPDPELRRRLRDRRPRDVRDPPRGQPQARCPPCNKVPRRAAMRILVIEDEPRILGFLRLGLEAEGFTVDGAADGATGLARAISESYELIVLDLQLPR